VNTVKITRAIGSDNVTSGLERRALVVGEEDFKVAPQTAQRELSSAFFDPQVAQIVVFGDVFADFLAMGNLLVVSSRSWHYTSTYGVLGTVEF
jgi:hypothetical protein